MIIQIKHSANTGNVPLALANGELAINTADEKLFYRHANGSIVLLASGATLGTANDNVARAMANGAYATANAAYTKANGSVQTGFTTINVGNGQNNIVATSNTDTLILVAGESIVLTTDAPNNRIMIAVTTIDGGTF